MLLASHDRLLANLNPLLALYAKLIMRFAHAVLWHLAEEVLLRLSLLRLAIVNRRKLRLLTLEHASRWDRHGWRSALVVVSLTVLIVLIGQGVGSHIGFVTLTLGHSWVMHRAGSKIV